LKIGHGIGRSGTEIGRGSRRAGNEEAVLRGTAMFGVAGELFTFLLVRRKYWLYPVVVALALLGGVVVLGKGSAVMPLIYTIF
jgi:uncharacterized protein DUF5989